MLRLQKFCWCIRFVILPHSAYLTCKGKRFRHLQGEWISEWESVSSPQFHLDSSSVLPQICETQLWKELTSTHPLYRHTFSKLVTSRCYPYPSPLAAMAPSWFSILLQLLFLVKKWSIVQQQLLVFPSLHITMFSSLKGQWTFQVSVG